LFPYVVQHRGRCWETPKGKGGDAQRIENRKADRYIERETVEVKERQRKRDRETERERESYYHVRVRSAYL